MIAMSSTLVIIALTLGAPGLKDPPKKEPSVIGVWVAESYTYAGKPRAVGPRPIRYEFTADLSPLTVEHTAILAERVQRAARMDTPV